MAYTRDVTTMLVRKMADQRAASANVNGTLDATTLLVQELETARANQANAQKDLNLNRTGFIGGLFLREDGAHGTTQQVLPRIT